ncbi:hypothetical protein X949_5837 [Burkholderia pseudomallei MSHR5609]|nr:hypothetical protein X949_5837 [Burkholderia pseudomallei MSHR5609]
MATTTGALRRFPGLADAHAYVRFSDTAISGQGR